MSEKYPNFFSIAKASDGSVWKTASPDVRPVQIRAAGDTSIIRIPSVGVHIPAGLTVSDAFKLSGVVGLHISRLAVTHDGRIAENAFDANNECRDVRIEEAYLQEGDQNAVTIKGGCRGFDLGLVKISGSRGHCDMEFGNYSEQSSAKSSNIRIGAVECDGGSRPCRYRVGWAKDVRIEHGRTEYQVLPSLLVRLYCAFLYRKLP